MKRNIKSMVALFGVVLMVVCSVAPSYYVYAEDPVSQAVTSDDNIVQKILDFALSNWGAVYKTNNNITNLPTTITNNLKEIIASAMNGGGIYVDDDGNYVFNNEVTQDLYDAMQTNTNVDARVISNFSNFSYFADGYVNSTFLGYCNEVTAYGKDFMEQDGAQGYILYSDRYETDTSVVTYVFCFRLNQSFAYLCPGSVNSNGFYSIYARMSSGNSMGLPCKYCQCSYSKVNGQYSTNISGNISGVSALHIMGNNVDVPASALSINDFYNSFPNITATYNNRTTHDKYYCNNSLLLAKTTADGSAILNQTEGVFSSYTDITNIDKTVLEENNWQEIYYNYITTVNNEFQKDPSISTSDLRKILKRYSDSIVNEIHQGNEEISEGIDISNRYLQAISVDVRNIVDRINEITDNGSSGISTEQYNALMGKLDDIYTNAQNIKDEVHEINLSTDGSYLELQDINDKTDDLLDYSANISSNTYDTATRLVAIDTLLQQINSKLRNRNHDNPLPDDNFWMLLDDELDDYTDTLLDSLIFKLQLIGNVLQGVVPFGYVAVIGVMLNALAVEPEEPTFEIDLNSDSTTIPVHYNGTIDLSWVDDIMPMVRAFEVMLFILGLIWASFTIFTTLGSLFG